MPLVRLHTLSSATPSMARINAAQFRLVRLVAESGAFALSGVDAYLSAGDDAIVAGAGEFALTGNNAALLQSQRLDVGAGEFTLTGSVAAVSRGLSLLVDSGVFSMTGLDAGLTRPTWQMASETGAFVLSGQAAALINAYKLDLAAGAFAVSGQDAAFLIGGAMVAEAGTYALTGNAVDLRKAHRLAAEVGAFVLTGSAAGLARARQMQAGAGGYALTGVAADLLRALQLTAGTGSFALTGNAAGTLQGNRLAAAAASYALSGQSATLTYEELSGITVEGTSETTTSTGSGTESVSLPGTPAEDDVYIVAMSIDTAPGSYGSAAAAAGWTSLYTSPSNSPASLVLLKRMTSSPDSSVSIERDGTNQSCIAIVQVKGVDTTTALDAALVSADGGSGMPDAPSHTTATAGALRIATGHLDDDTVASSTISGWTVLASGAPDSSTMLAYKIAETAGADNPAAFSGAGDDAWYATHFSLRPA